MIETPADYRSFVFYKANKTPVCSLRSSFRSFVSLRGTKQSLNYYGVTIRRSSFGQAFHCKSSHLLRRAVGFPFQSFTQTNSIQNFISFAKNSMNSMISKDALQCVSTNFVVKIIHHVKTHSCASLQILRKLCH